MYKKLELLRSSNIWFNYYNVKLEELVYSIKNFKIRTDYDSDYDLYTTLLISILNLSENKTSREIYNKLINSENSYVNQLANSINMNIPSKGQKVYIEYRFLNADNNITSDILKEFDEESTSEKKILSIYSHATKLTRLNYNKLLDFVSEVEKRKFDVVFLNFCNSIEFVSHFKNIETNLIVSYDSEVFNKEGILLTNYFGKFLEIYGNKLDALKMTIFLYDCLTNTSALDVNFHYLRDKTYDDLKMQHWFSDLAFYY